MTVSPRTPSHPNAAPDVPRLGLVRPPLVYLVSIVTGVSIQLAWPLPFLPGRLAAGLGAPVVTVAIALVAYAVVTFRAAGTPVPARKPTTVICRIRPVSIQPKPDLPGVLALPARPRDLGQQPVAAGDARGGGGTHALRRRPERGGAPGAEIRCPIPGVQGLRASVAVKPPAVHTREARASARAEDQGGAAQGHGRAYPGPRRTDGSVHAGVRRHRR
jgi:hypothetical protein